MGEVPWRMEEMRQKSGEGALKLAKQRNCNSFHPLCFAGWLTHHTGVVAVSEGSLSFLLSECFPHVLEQHSLALQRTAVPAVAPLMHLFHQPRGVPGPVAWSRECITLYLFQSKYIFFNGGNPDAVLWLLWAGRAVVTSQQARGQCSSCCVLSSLSMLWLQVNTSDVGLTGQIKVKSEGLGQVSLLCVS